MSDGGHDTDAARALRREQPDSWHRGEDGILRVQYGPCRAGWGWHVWPDQRERRPAAAKPEGAERDQID